MCMLDDVIEFGGSEAKKYVPHCLPVFLRNMTSEHHILRQSSLYGLAQSLRYAPDDCVPVCAQIVPALVATIHNPLAKEEDYEGSTENALFALGIICHNPVYRSCAWGGVDSSQVDMLTCCEPNDDLYNCGVTLTLIFHYMHWIGWCYLASGVTITC